MNRKLPPESFDLYVGLGIGRSYQQVADHFGVSKGTVTALAQRDAWQNRLAKVEREARSRADEKAVETLEQVNERHLKIARALQGKALEGLRSMSLTEAKDVIRALELGVRQERLIVGEPTAREAYEPGGVLVVPAQLTEEEWGRLAKQGAVHASEVGRNGNR